MKDTLIDKDDLLFFRTLRKNLVFNEIYQYYLKLSEEEGLRQSHIANRLGWNRSRVNTLFSEPSNLTLNTISDLLEALSADMKFSVFPAIQDKYTAGEFNAEFKEGQWRERDDFKNVREINTASRNVTLTSGDSFATAA